MQAPRAWWFLLGCGLVGCGGEAIAPPDDAAGSGGQAHPDGSGGSAGQSSGAGGCGGVDMGLTACECHASYPDGSDVSGSELYCCLRGRNGPPSACTADTLGTVRRCPGALPPTGSACGWSGATISGIPTSACDGVDPATSYCVYRNDEGTRTLVTCIDGQWQSKGCGADAGASRDAAADVDASRSCPPAGVCNGACLEGRRNTAEIVDGCTVSHCCALIDAGVPSDAGDAADAGSETGAWGACGSCPAGNVCVEHQFVGTPRGDRPDDAGQCPTGLHSVPEQPLFCAPLPTFECAPLASTCGTDSGIPPTANCPCGSICQCSNISERQVRCVQPVP